MAPAKPRPIAEAFGIFWTNPMNGLVIPCEGYALDVDGKTISGDHDDGRAVAAHYADGKPILTYEGFASVSLALVAARSYGPNYSVRILPKGSRFHLRDAAETLMVVGDVQPDPTHKPFAVKASIRGIPVMCDTIMAATVGAAVEEWRNHFAERADKLRAAYPTFNAINRGFADGMIKLFEAQAAEGRAYGVEFSARPSRARAVDRVA